MSATRPAGGPSHGAPPLITAKLLAPPPRVGMVGRPRLLARLDACQCAAVTVLSAPAGFGKTTLLAAWIAAQRGAEREGPPVAFAWVSLDAEDADPPRFWSYVVAALRRAVPELPPELNTPLRASQPQVEVAVTALANALAALPVEVVLILDDYHTLSGAEVHRTLAALLEQRPPSLHVVIAGRSDPPLPLARLRARGLMDSLRAADLRFSEAEASAFLSETMGLELEDEAVAALASYTEGWPAGLQLAALWLRDHPEAGARGIAALADDDRYLSTFLAEEIFQRQSPELQRFLLDTALLDRLCPELCDYLTAEARRHTGDEPAVITRPSAAILEDLVRRNLFVTPLDARGEWYRYHTIFGDALRRQLGRQRGQGALARLHRRAAGWFAAASTEDPALLGEAVRHALEARSFDLAADLILPRADQLGSQGHMGELIAWLSALPAEALAARPALALRFAWVLFLHGRQNDAARWLETAEAALAERPDPDPLTMALPHVIRAAMATTSHDDAIILGHAERALALLPPDEPVWRLTIEIARGLAHQARGEAREAAACYTRATDLGERSGNSYGVMIGAYHLGYMRLQQGRLDEACRVFRRIGALGEPYGGYADVGLARIAFERDDMPAAQRLALAGLRSLEATGGQPRVLIGAQGLLARLAWGAGDPEAARAWLDHAEALGRRLELAEDLSTLAYLRALIAGGTGDTRAAEEWAAASGLDAATPDMRREPELLALARIMAAHGRAGDALRLAGALLARAEAQGRIMTVIECELTRAIALERGGQTSSARAAVATALALAGPEGIARPFREAGPIVHELAEALRADPRAADPAAPLARGLAIIGTGHALEASAPPAALRLNAADYEPLSEREQRVLALIAADCSNQEIASALVVSVNTVKTHVKRIYEKLQVNSRVGAVERARELGLHK